jgi:2-polyprenyl-3-methyl-5-hydroxy-6-metoxy-1,4-benzoquinol methylase
MRPLPDPAWLNKLYAKEYFSEFLPGVDYIKQAQDLAPAYSRRAVLFFERGCRRVLDVGCATGAFLKALQLAGVTCAGIEISEYAAAEARKTGFDVQVARIEEAVVPNNTYDGIHIAHVLEHVVDPAETLLRLRQWLTPRGLLYVEVPNQFESLTELLDRRLGRTMAFGLTSVHHVNFFSPRSLTRLLRQTGWTVESCSTFDPLRRVSRSASLRSVTLQAALWFADRFFQRGDIIAIWARASELPSSE